jgi:hypothetical protein
VKTTTVSPEWNKRPCPACGSGVESGPEIKGTVQAELISYNDVREYFIGIRSEQIFFSYHRCDDCLTLYCPYYFSEAQLDALYSDMPDNLLGAEKSTVEKTQVGYFKFFRKKVKNVSSYLELGPDIGLVTKEVLRNFRPIKTYLIEPNSAMHEILNSLSPESSLKIYRSLEESHLQDIDFTVGIHVFDHLLMPREQIKQIFSQTKPGGLIGVVVHNESSLLRKILGKKWPPFCLQHPQLYNKKSLTRIMETSGFEVLKISNSINHFSLRHLGGLAIEIIGLPKFLVRFLPSIELPVMLGNQISIFRKPF